MFAFDNSISKLNLLLFFRFVIAKVCIFCGRLIGTAVDFNDLHVFLLSYCHVAAQNYIFHVSVDL